MLNATLGNNPLVTHKSLFLAGMKNNYNNLAPFYDFLSRLVFGDAIIQSQRFLVEAIPANSTVLIVGGGTGFILEEIGLLHKGDLRITYVEASEKMIEISKKRNIGCNPLIFIHLPIQETSFKKKFNVVITPFLLDNFSNHSAKIVFNIIHDALQPNGLWLFADFNESRIIPLWQRFLLKCMYYFFRVFCRIEARELPDTKSLFDACKYKIVSSRFFFRSFICSVIYQRQ